MGIKESLKETVDLAKGSEFFVPVQAFKCKLCEKIFRTEADAQAHFLSACHNEKYDQFKAQNPNYELLRLEKMQKSVAEKRKDIENQRRLAREKLQMKQLIKAKRLASSVHKSPVVTPECVVPEVVVPEVVNQPVSPSPPVGGENVVSS